MRVSVVVPTYRRDALLARCLRRLQRQRLTPQQYEIIVADDAASEATRRLVNAFRTAGRADVRYVSAGATGPHGPARARNTGWRAALAPIVAFTDDDCLPRRDWLSAGLAAMEGADAATGRTQVPLPQRPTDHQRDISGLVRAAFITANCFCRREVLEELGGFDERFTSAWREDSDLHFSLLERGKRIVAAEAAVVMHPARAAHWGASVRLQRRGMFDPLLYRKHPRLYRQQIPPLPRWYYAAAAALPAAALGIWLRRPACAWCAGAAWAALTIFFAARRLGGNSLSPSHIAEMIVTSAIIPPLSLYWRLRGSLRYRAFYP